MEGHYSHLRDAHIKYLQILKVGECLLFDSFLDISYLENSIFRADPERLL